MSVLVRIPPSRLLKPEQIEGLSRLFATSSSWLQTAELGYLFANGELGLWISVRLQDPHECINLAL